MDNVVHLVPTRRPSDHDAFMRSKPYGERAPRCDHKQTVVDPHNRTLACRSCGALLDPFGFLMGIVHEGDMLVQMCDSIKRLRDELEELHDEERKVKQRVRSWRLKLPVGER